jgi:transcriptional regulator with XRE-family HTH domain
MEITAKTAEKELPAFREKHGITLEVISEKTGIAISTLIAIGKGKVKPQPKTIYKLNKYLSTFT